MLSSITHVQLYHQDYCPQTPSRPFPPLSPASPATPAAVNRCNVDCRGEQPEAVKEALVAPLLAGLASHHAGCLPAWKALVERCFQQGLLKVCPPQTQ